MKNSRILLKRLLSLIGFLLFAIPLYAQTKLPECDADVPFFTFDLSGSPDTTFLTPKVERQGHCCGSTNSDLYLSFYATLHPQVAMFEIVVAPGYADPGGSGDYNIISGGDLTIPGSCGTDIPGGQPVCISGSGPYKITYSKPGKNNIKYIFRQIPRPIFPANDTTRLGCSLPLAIYGLDAITMTSVNSSSGITSRGFYNSLLSCTNCSNPSFTPGLTTPAWIDYEICGTPQASLCGVFTSCDTVRIYTTSALSGSVTPNPASFCSNESGVDLVGLPVGGDGHYTYIWRNSLGTNLSTNDSLTVNSAGTYTLEIGDGLTSATCPNKFLSVPVTVGTLPIVDAGSAQTVCASDPTIYLNGSSSTSSGTWSGGSGTFSPGNNLVAAYTPTPTEISSGSIKLYLTATNVDAGCENVTDSVTIAFSPLVAVNPSANPILCHDGQTTISANASGGTVPYTYFWNTGSVNSSITATAGTYSVTAYDQFGCSASANTFISNSTPLALAMSSTNTSTDIDCDGQASVSVTGGNSPYSYLWSTTETNPATTNNLCYGIYTVTVTDDNGCSITGSVVVNKPSCSSFNATASSTHVSCFAGTDGTANVSATGGTAPYSYSWNTAPVQTTASITGLSSGNYTVIVTDNLGCTDVASTSVLQPLILTNSITYTNVTTIGGMNGTATANPSGGTPGYTYLWEPGSQTTATATNLASAPGGVTYHITVTDANSCQLEDSVIINEPPCNNFYLGVNLTHVSCFAGSNGAAGLVIVDGTAPYDIHWSNGATSTSISGLIAGNYSVSVTDASNCTAIKTFTIGQPDALSLGLVPTNVTCNNAGDGTIDLTVDGGTFPYTYKWYNGITQIADHEDLIDLTPGTYSVTVSDKNGCSISASSGITQPTALVSNFTSVDASCYGTASGSINASVTGGVLPYTYAWTGPSSFSATTQDLSNLNVGLYHLITHDANGCENGPMDVFINQPSLLTINAVQTAQVSCNGASDGAINATPNGGTLPYSYLWSGPTAYSSTLEDPSGLFAGSYSVTLTDNKGCTATTNINVTTVSDNTAPVINCHNDTIVKSNNSCAYLQVGAGLNATATDNCQLSTLTYNLTGTTSGSGNSLGNISFNKGITTVTWTATDAAGNSATCSFNVTVNDSTAPSIVSCGVTGTANVFTDPGFCSYTHHGSTWIPNVSDNCIDAVALAYSITGATSGSGTNSLNNVEFNYGMSTVIWTVTDISGNTATCSFNVLVDDQQAPIFANCGALSDTFVNADPSSCIYRQNSDVWNASAVDLCTTTTLIYTLSGATIGTGTTLNGANLNLGMTQIVWTATDQDGNSATCSFNVTVEDTQAPQITCIGNQFQNVDAGQCNYTKTGTGWDAIASDNCTISSVLASLTGATTATGLSSLANVDFNLGTTTILWTATDGSGNTSSCSFDVTVSDNILPSVTSCGASGNQSVNADADECNFTKTGAGWDASTSDNCSVNSVLASLSGATSATGLSTLSNVDFNLGTTVVVWTVTDGSGNTSTCSFNVTVSDNQSPTFNLCGAGTNQFVTTDLSSCTYQHQDDLWNAQASDLCSATSLTYALSGATSGAGNSMNGQLFNKGVTLVTWTATDAAGNTATCSFNVTVEDVEIPSILSCGTGGLISIPSNNGLCTYTQTSNIWNATASDNCGSVSLHYDLNGATSGSGSTLSGQTFNLGTTNVIWTATDASGNTATCSFDVEVTDQQMPVITTCGGGSYVVQTSVSSCEFIQETSAWDAFATDNCGAVSLGYVLSGATQGSGTSLSGASFNLGLTTVTWTASDQNGNSSACSFTIQVNDAQAPVISNCIGSQSAQFITDPGSCTFTQPNASLDPIATDNCTILSGTCNLSGATLGTYSTLSGANFNIGTTYVQWTFSDQSGNTATCGYSVTVTDQEAPTLANCPGDIYINTAPGQCGRIISWTPPIVTDNCQATLVSNIQPGTFFQTGSTVITYTATDASGNQSTCTFSVNVTDLESPVISCLGDISSCEPYVNYTIPSVSDNCGVQGIILKMVCQAEVSSP
jgi:hypothetical protein